MSSPRKIMLKTKKEKGVKDGVPYENQTDVVEFKVSIPISNYGYVLENFYLILGELPKSSSEYPDLQDAICSISQILTQFVPCEMDMRAFLKSQKLANSLQLKVSELETKLKQFQGK